MDNQNDMCKGVFKKRKHCKHENQKKFDECFIILYNFSVHIIDGHSATQGLLPLLILVEDTITFYFLMAIIQQACIPI